MAVLEYHNFLQQAINAIGDSVTALFTGDVAGAIGNLLLAFPVVGAFMVMYGLVYFAGIISIFKDTNHKSYARYIAIGVSLIGLLNVDVMNFLINFLGGTMIIILLLIMVVSFIVGKWVNARKGHFENAAGKDRAKVGALEAKRARLEQSQENKMQKNLHKNELGALKQIKGKVNLAMNLAKDSLETIKYMIQILTKISSLSDAKERERLQLHLTKRLGGFTTQIDEEYLDIEKARRELVRLQEFEMKGIRIDAKETEVLKNVNKYIRERIGSVVETNLSKEDPKKHVTEKFEVLREAARGLTNKLILLDQKRIKLIEETEKYIELVENEFKTNIVDLRQKLNVSLHSGDIPTSLNILNHLYGDLQKIQRADGSIAQKINDISTFENDKADIEKEFDVLVNLAVGKKTLREAANSKWNKMGDRVNKEIGKIRNKNKKGDQDIKKGNADISQEKSQENQTRKNTGNT